MGEGIDYDEVERFRKELTKTIVGVYSEDPCPNDSPVYTFLENLTPPARTKAIHAVAEAAAERAPGAGQGSTPGGEGAKGDATPAVSHCHGLGHDRNRLRSDPLLPRFPRG